MEREKIVMLVASNIEAAMKRRGTNPAELARVAGLNPTGIYDILSGKSKAPRLDTIGKIAGALQMPVAALFENKEADELREQIMSALFDLPDDECRRLLLTARAWATAKIAPE